MSFGWSASDIVTALKLLYQISNALQDAGGASSQFRDALSFLQTLSQTLQHLKVLQAVPLDLGLAVNLREQCDHIRLPLVEVLDDITRRFEPTLSEGSTINHILAAPRKIQWALSTSKKIRRLQERIAVPMAAVGLILGQQILQTTLALPDDIQNRISRVLDAAIDTKISPTVALLVEKMEALSTGRTDPAQMTTELELIRCTTSGSIEKNASGGRISMKGLENTSNVGLESAEKPTKRVSSRSVVRIVPSVSRVTIRTVRKQASKNHARNIGLHRKLDQVDSSITAIQVSLQDISNASTVNLDTSESEIHKTVQKILSSVWVILSGLHQIIRELIVLLAPYLISFYRSNVERLRLCGEHFLFEDAIGRMKRLPCDQFQHWNIFYDFLIKSFQGAPGLSLVLAGQFLVNNGYNSSTISRDTWRTAIQPKCRVTMSMLLDNIETELGRCVNPTCKGWVSLRADATQICPVCGKYLSLSEEVWSVKEFQPLGVSPLTAGSSVEKEIERDVHTPTATRRASLKSIPRMKAPLNKGNPKVAASEVSAFKRVTLRLKQRTESEPFKKDYAETLPKEPLPIQSQNDGPVFRAQDLALLKHQIYAFKCLAKNVAIPKATQEAMFGNVKLN